MANKLSILEFSTGKNQYIFDSITSNVIYTNETISYIIKNFYNITQEEMFYYLKEICSVNRDSFTKNYEYIKKLITSGMFYYNDDKVDNVPIIDCEYAARNTNTSQLILVVTEACNLRCHYCIYSDKYPFEISYTKDEMSFEYAKKAIDIYFKLHSERLKRGIRKSPIINFYGGEPLLKIGLIKKIVNYAKEIFPNIVFYLTTNGTIMNDEIVELVIHNNFVVTFSLDGFKENHDRNRVYANGSPSFDQIIGNIKYLQDKKKEDDISQVISFNCCFDYYTDLYNVLVFFEENYNIFEPFFLMFNQINPYDTTYYEWCDKLCKEQNWEYNKGTLGKSIKQIHDVFFDRKILRPKFKELAKNLMLGYFSLIIRNRGVFSSFNNSCKPTSKMAVYPDGTITLCEKMNKKLPIGNVKNGINWKKIEEYSNRLIKFFHSECIKCSIRPLCSACFMYLNKNGINKEFCKEEKKKTIKNISYLFEKLEEDEDILELLIPDENNYHLYELNK